MIEKGIYFALGCIVTALLALAFAPVYWNRALRLTRRRLQLQIPVSMQEILADRDQLRAQFAVERVRLEQAIERVEARRAADMAEIGRRTAEVAALTEALAASQRVEKDQARDIQHLARTLAEAGTEIGSLQMGLHSSDVAFDQVRRHLSDATAELQTLRDEVRERRTLNASLETRSMGLEMRLTDAERAHAAKEKRNEAALRSRLEAAMGHASRHEASAISLQRERDDAKARVSALEQELEAAREREKAVHLQRSLQSEKARGADKIYGERLDLLQAENAALQEALETVKREHPPEEADGVEADAGLRESIHALGLAVAVLSRGPREAETRGTSQRPRDAAVPNPKLPA